MRERGSRKPPPQPLDSRTAEILGHAHFSQRGWRVLVSPYDPASYDFVAERDDTFVRVQVKRASDDRGAYKISKPGANRQVKDPDLYLVWLPRERQFVEYPGSFMKGRTSRTLPVASYHHLKDLDQ